VEEGLFEQAPAEPPQAPEPEVLPVASSSDAAGAAAPAASSRFAYDTLTAPTASAAAAAEVPKRGKDGHLTLGLSNDDFFKVCDLLGRTARPAHPSQPTSPTHASPCAPSSAQPGAAMGPAPSAIPACACRTPWRTRAWAGVATAARAVPLAGSP
jgi:hypothetical protein